MKKRNYGYARHGAAEEQPVRRGTQLLRRQSRHGCLRCVRGSDRIEGPTKKSCHAGDGTDAKRDDAGPLRHRHPDRLCSNLR